MSTRKRPSGDPAGGSVPNPTSSKAIPTVIAFTGLVSAKRAPHEGVGYPHPAKKQLPPAIRHLIQQRVARGPLPEIAQAPSANQAEEGAILEVVDKNGCPGLVRLQITPSPDAPPGSCLDVADVVDTIAQALIAGGVGAMVTRHVHNQSQSNSYKDSTPVASDSPKASATSGKVPRLADVSYSSGFGCTPPEDTRTAEAIAAEHALGWEYAKSLGIPEEVRMWVRPGTKLTREDIDLYKHLPAFRRIQDELDAEDEAHLKAKALAKRSKS